ncbi:hypothetical protein HMPREF3036_00389 [Sutterella sp. KLE1602]|nr:hypothetical protein HMPREF3036_00389 [Sutterella sp. KLE1602]
MKVPSPHGMRVTNVDRVHCIARAVVGLRARPAPFIFFNRPYLFA